MTSCARLRALQLLACMVWELVVFEGRSTSTLVVHDPACSPCAAFKHDCDSIDTENPFVLHKQTQVFVES